MLKRGFIPYIVGGCIVVFIFVSYVGYRAYQRHIEFERFIADSQMFNGSVEHDEADGHLHLSSAHTFNEKNTSLFPVTGTNQGGSSSSSFFKGKQGDEYVYKINGIPIYSNTPMSDESIGTLMWVKTGQMNPGAEYNLETRPDYKHDVLQRVVTPDGQLHHVIVPRFSMYEEGDAILESEIREARHLLEGPRDPERLSLNIAGVDYPIPDEYYAIEDRHEREVYFEKFSVSIEKGISMAEVDRQIAAGEISLAKLSEVAKNTIEQLDKQKERAKMLLPEMPPLSDKPPVKVRFLPNTGNERRLPGWRRKMINRRSTVGSGGQSDSRDPKSTILVSEEDLPLDTNTTPVRSDGPLFPFNQPGRVESMPSRRSEIVSDAPKTPALPTAQSLETQLRDGLSPERFSKAQQLIDQYGTEEGLRRLRQTDPDAARQFERQRSTPPTRSEPATR